MPPSQEYRPLSTLKQVTWVRMSAPSLKIRTSIILNLAKIGISNYKQRNQKFIKQMGEKVKGEIYLQILDAMLGSDWTDKEVWKQKLENLKQGHYDDHIITVLPGWNSENLISLGFDLPFPPQRPITKPIKQILAMLHSIYYDKLKGMYAHTDLTKEALKNVQEQGIVFLDEIDKLATPQGMINTGKGVSTEGVQRDLLPIIEGTVVNTKFGQVKTDHILFIASGSFSMAKVEDLIPELIGRLPIRVSLNPITLEQFFRILTQPQFNLLMQQQNLLKAENIDLKFDRDAIQKMAEYAYEMNQNTENIGARRLHAIVEKILQDISFEAPDRKGESITITKDYVIEKLDKMNTKINLAKYLI